MLICMSCPCRAKNFGWDGAWGAARAAARDAMNRVVIGLANLLLVFVHLSAWLPGALRGLRRKDRLSGSLSTK